MLSSIRFIGRLPGRGALGHLGLSPAEFASRLLSEAGNSDCRRRRLCVPRELARPVLPQSRKELGIAGP
jgi:hypothetical protein